MIKVIDSKKVDMTNDEWDMYTKICKSYTFANNKGEDLFVDLFETDESGIIIFLKPPSKRQTSLEVFLFLASLMNHQHLRLMHKQIDDLGAEIREKLKNIDTR